jgi:hypothetical protein
MARQSATPVQLDAVTTEQAVSTAPGRLTAIAIYNPGASLAWFHLYNATTGGTTVGTTERWMSFPVPAGGWYLDSWPEPPGFSAALTAAATTTKSGATPAGTGLEVIAQIGGA